MLYTEETLQGKRVFLNGRVVVSPLAADDEEGWVEVLDLSGLEELLKSAESGDMSSPIDIDSVPDSEVIELPTCKLYGKVEVRQAVGMKLFNTSAPKETK